MAAAGAGADVSQQQALTGWRRLVHACCRNDVDAVTAAVAPAMAVDCTHFDNYALKCACTNGRTQAVEVLLALDAARGVNVNADDGEPLAAAAGNGHQDTVRLLLAHGADPGLRNGRPLRRAAAAGHEAIVRALLHNKALPRDVIDQAQQDATQNGHCRLANMLAQLQHATTPITPTCAHMECQRRPVIVLWRGQRRVLHTAPH